MMLSVVQPGRVARAPWLYELRAGVREIYFGRLYERRERLHARARATLLIRRRR